jgi:hypothetical protein
MKNFLSEWCSSGDDTKNGGWDILVYFPFAILTEASLMRRYHKKLSSWFDIKFNRLNQILW